MRLFLVPCLLFNFGILAVLKYLLIGSGLTGTELVLPMGISFYTFQTMGYLINVYRGKAAAERNIFRARAVYVVLSPARSGAHFRL